MPTQNDGGSVPSCDTRVKGPAWQRNAWHSHLAGRQKYAGTTDPVASGSLQGTNRSHTVAACMHTLRHSWTAVLLLNDVAIWRDWYRYGDSNPGYMAENHVS